MNTTCSFNQTEHTIQNYCVTYTHDFEHKYSRFTNSFVIKAANVTPDKALQIANILFPEHTDKEIVSVENDVLTLTPSEYEYLRSLVRSRRQSSLRAQEHRIKAGTQKGPLTESEHDKYLLNLMKKMNSRMNQFPTYHT